MQQLMAEASRLASFDVLLNFTIADLPASFRAEHSERLALPRGGGYWLWKPFLVHHVLQNLMQEGDVLLYLDAGCQLLGSSPAPWVQLARAHGSLFFRLTHAQQAWTKGDVFEALGLSMEDFGRERQVLSGIFLLTRSAATLQLAADWLHYTEVLQLASDSPSVAPNHPSFQEHRHDQSILSLLLQRHARALSPLILEDQTWPLEAASIVYAARRGKG